MGVTPVNAQQRQQAAVSRSKVEDALNPPRDEFQQDGLALRAMRNSIGPREIVQRVPGRRVLVEVPRANHGGRGPKCASCEALGMQERK